MAADLKKNHIFVERIGGLFDSFNLNHDKYLTIDEILKWGANMEKLCKATADEINAMDQGLRDYWGVVGLIPGVQLTKQQFIHGFSRLAQNELKREVEGKPTLFDKMSNAFYDVTDINNDGTVTLDEAKTMYKACNLDPKDAEAWFKAADVNKNGIVERKELNKAEFDFFFHPEKSASEGMFAGFCNSKK